MKANKKHIAKANYFYLFTGYMEYKDGELSEPKPESIDTIRDTVVLTREKLPKDGKEKLVPWVTNRNGVFHKTNQGKHPFGDRATPIHSIQNKAVRKFLIPPKELIGLILGIKGQDWSKELCTKAGKKEGLPVKMFDIQKKHLRLPLKLKHKNESEQRSEDNYKAWYDKVKDDEILPGFIIPKTRAVLFLFTNPLFNKSEIDIWVSQKDLQKNNSLTAESIGRQITGSRGLKIPHYVLKLPKDELEPGIYTIRITLSKEFKNKDLSKNITDPTYGKEPSNDSSPGERSYTFTHKINFNLTNFSGEYDVVVCDPISVEEAFLNQFPVDYSHIISAAMQDGYGSELSLRDGDGKNQKWIAEKSPALKPVSDRIALGVSATQTAAKLYSASGASSVSWIIGKAIYDSFVSESKNAKNENLQFAMGAIGLAFGVNDTRNQWKGIAQTLIRENPERFADYLIKTEKSLDKLFDSSRLLKPLQNAVNTSIKSSKSKVLELATDKILEDAGIKPGNAKFVKAAAWIDAILSSYSAVHCGVQYYDGKKQTVLAQKNLSELISAYDSKLGGIPNREGIGIIEKQRKNSVLKKSGADQKLREMHDKMLDAAMGVMCLTPLAVPASIFVASKATVQLLSAAMELALKTFFREQYDLGQNIVKTTQYSHANQSLIPESKDNKTNQLEAQFRLRAEALNGLFGLILRAGISTKTQSEYLDKLINKYQVETYIKNYVLNDQWEFPVKPLVPVSMDEYWYYASSSYRTFVKFADNALSRTSSFKTTLLDNGFNRNFGFENPLSAKNIAKYMIPGAMCIMSVLDKALEENHKADFQKYFPVHYFESGSAAEFAKAFKMSYRQIDKDCLEYTCIYTRPNDSKADAPWLPVADDAVNCIDDLKAVSPRSQIRVFVVLKKKDGDGSPIQGLYPMTIQLKRTDVWGADGPVYKGLARELTDRDLISGEKQWKGRVGCVFYPLYQFNVSVIPGTKPMAGWFLNMENAQEHFNRGYLTEMLYSYSLRVGSHDVVDRIKIGRKGKKQNTENDLCQYKVTVDLDQPEEKRLTSIHFLKSRTSKPMDLPRLFKGGRSGAGGCLIKIGNDDYRLPEKDGIFRARDNFDWGTDSVDIIVLFWAWDLMTGDYIKEGRPWKELPVSIELMNPDNKAKGPQYQSIACYLGEYNQLLINYHTHPFVNKTPAFMKDPDADQYKNLAPLVKHLDNPGSPLFNDIYSSMYSHRSIEQDLKVMNELYIRHLYAAHFTLGYTPPVKGTKMPFKSIRPFGSKQVYSSTSGGRQDYIYTITNIQMPKSVGFTGIKSTPEMTLRDGRRFWEKYENGSPVQLCFPAPEKQKGFPHLENLGMSKSEIDTWITRDTTMRIPPQELF